MYAIIETGGKQYKAEKDMVLIVEKLEGEPGTEIVLESVLMMNSGGKISIGSPFVKGAKVKAEIVRQAKGPKIKGFNYKAKKNQRKRWGHRQPQTFLRVIDVSA
jgi:large subunit ribosomal protein L21